MYHRYIPPCAIILLKLCISHFYHIFVLDLHSGLKVNNQKQHSICQIKQFVVTKLSFWHFLLVSNKLHITQNSEIFSTTDEYITLKCHILLHLPIQNKEDSIWSIIEAFQHFLDKPIFIFFQKLNLCNN